MQVDRLAAGNMRSAVLDVFSDADVRIVRTGPDALSALRSAKPGLAILGLSAADLAWAGDLPEILALLKGTPSLLICGRHAPRTFRMLNRFPSISIFDPVTEGPMELRAALKGVSEGRRYLSPEIQSILKDTRAVKPEQFLSLTEEKVLSVIGDGSDEEEAFGRLPMAPATLATHRRNIMKKLELHHRGQIVRFALKHGYVTRALDGSLVPGLVAVLAESEFGDRGPGPRLREPK